MSDLLDGLTQPQMQALLDWLWVNNFKVTRANVKGWKRKFLA